MKEPKVLKHELFPNNQKCKIRNSFNNFLVQSFKIGEDFSESDKKKIIMMTEADIYIYNIVMDFCKETRTIPNQIESRKLDLSEAFKFTDEN